MIRITLPCLGKSKTCGKRATWQDDAASSGEDSSDEWEDEIERMSEGTSFTHTGMTLTATACLDLGPRLGVFVVKN